MYVQQEISLEALKNSTIQLLLRVDTTQAELVTEKIMSKMRKQRNFTIIEKRNRDTMDRNSNKQDGSKIEEIPSNGQGSEVKQRDAKDSDDEDEERKDISSKRLIGGSLPKETRVLQFHEDTNFTSSKDSKLDRSKDGLR